MDNRPFMLRHCVAINKAIDVGWRVLAVCYALLAVAFLAMACAAMAGCEPIQVEHKAEVNHRVPDKIDINVRFPDRKPRNNSQRR